ncbi:MAG: hypothetical protein U9O53_02220 [archaeon]|nr:hypothetical protein [archaeon]
MDDADTGLDRFTEKILPDQTIMHEDKDVYYRDRIIYYLANIELIENNSMYRLNNMIGVVREIIDKNDENNRTVAYFIEPIYDVCIAGKSVDDKFYRYIEDIYSPDKIRSINPESKVNWFKYLMKCKRISEIPESMPDKKKDDNGEGNTNMASGCVSDLYDNNSVKNGYPVIFD